MSQQFLVKFALQIVTTRFLHHGQQKKMSPTKKTHGKGATISCLINFIHASQLIRNKYLNPASGQRLEDCITVRQEVKRINRKDQLAIVIHHSNFNLADTQAKLVNTVDTTRDDINLQLFECASFSIRLTSLRLFHLSLLIAECVSCT